MYYYPCNNGNGGGGYPGGPTFPTGGYPGGATGHIPGPTFPMIAIPGGPTYPLCGVPTPPCPTCPPQYCPNIPGFPPFPGCPEVPNPCPNPGPQWPSNGGCSCCDECDSYGDGSEGNDHYEDDPTRPCCQNGNCLGCQSIAGDTPWLMPKAIGCGRFHRCDFKWWFYVKESELDNHDLPGRPPHTIMCVRATGTTKARIACEKMQKNNGSVYPENTKQRCLDSYDLWLCLTIPVEIIVRDCSGFLYCLHSSFSTYIRIPLIAKFRNIKDAQVYIKVRVRLCGTVKVYNRADNSCDGLSTAMCPGADGSNALNRQYGCRDATGIVGCTIPGTSDDADDDDTDGTQNNTDSSDDPSNDPDRLGPQHLPMVRLDVLAEACVMRLVPYGNLGPDPYACDQTKVPNYFPN